MSPPVASPHTHSLHTHHPPPSHTLILCPPHFTGHPSHTVPTATQGHTTLSPQSLMDTTTPSPQSHTDSPHCPLSHTWTQSHCPHGHNHMVLTVTQRLSHTVPSHAWTQPRLPHSHKTWSPQPHKDTPHCPHPTDTAHPPRRRTLAGIPVTCSCSTPCRLTGTQSLSHSRTRAAPAAPAPLPRSPRRCTRKLSKTP